ncbi:MAG: methyltransferase domain-containing protein [Magnetococcales bacterium]|nr:methyltransferase domain-containing protein [Magnetococcales bacterium]
MNPAESCRVCGGMLYPEPLLCYDNMPGAAQFMPDAATLSSDHGEHLDVGQCVACGLIQLHGPPVHYWREVVRATAFSAEMREFRLRQFAEFATSHGLAGRKVLEVGCGRGEYLTLLRETGMAAWGVEHSETSVAHCRQAGLPVFQGSIDSPRQALPEAPFEGFFILSFLEHLPDPVATLRGIAANLTEGGVGLVEVPNFDMIVRNGLFSEFIRDHLFYFTSHTLTQLLCMAGFEVLECREVWHDYILSATVRKRARADLRHLLGFQERIHTEIHRYLDRFPPHKVAIWGAGHQALAVISLLKLQERVACVIDSAPFKQGKFTPASHLPIRPPDFLDSEPMEAVLVMAASYSDEVAGILRDRYDPGLGVAILRDFGLEVVRG